MSRVIVFLLVILSGVAAVSATFHPPIDAHAEDVAAWRAGRLQRLTAPNGWLSLVGLEWLKAGANRVGSAADNDIVLTVGPAHLGVVTLEADGRTRIAFAADAQATVDGRQVADAELVDDVHATDTPTTVAFGSASFYVIDREGRKGLRVKDPAAPTRTGFAGIDAFPVDVGWRIVADWQPAAAGETLEMGTAIGTTETYPVPGHLHFSRDGHDFELLPVVEESGDAQYFIVFADRTSGKETYGAARFLYVDPPDADGKVVIDFNKAYNPPCAFTRYATCPLAPPENRLDLRVTAGEKTYAGRH